MAASDGAPTSSKTLQVSKASAQTFASNLLAAHGVPPNHADTIADCLVSADLRGIDTHGLNRLPSYIRRITSNVLSPTATPTLSHLTPVVAQIDGRNSFGFLSAHLAMTTAISIATTYGIGMVSVKHSNHFGMSASFVQQAVDANMLSLVFTNSSPALPVWGGKSKLMGVSPIAAGAPAGKSPPFILDFAPSVAARGKVYKALRRGESIPDTWALDANGATTTDPAKALEGTMLPMGGPKGSALAIMMDVFSGVLSGSAFAGGVTNPYDPSKAADVGHFIVAIKPDLFMPLDEFKERMDHLYQTVVGSDRMEGVEKIYYPGELELICQKEREEGGIPYTKGEVESLNKEAEEVGVGKIEIMREVGG
jgi:LDH2 family malate/lactate/ureidoglycolate dehydrogenase